MPVIRSFFQMPSLFSGIRESLFGTAIDREKSFRLHCNDTIYYRQTNEAYCLNRIINQLLPMPLLGQLDNPVKIGYIPTPGNYFFIPSQSKSFLTAFDGLNG